jgi:hypothetical protein
MEMDYNITLQQEVLRELAADIHADYYHYMRKHHINDENMKNPVALLADDAFAMKDYILCKCDNENELNIARGKLRELQNIIERLKNGGKRCETVGV